MGKLLRFDSSKNIWVYDGLLTADIKNEIDERIEIVKLEIPAIEKELFEQYGDGVLYKYNLGLIMKEYVDKFDFDIRERRMFWIEIGKLAATKQDKRTENNTSKRNYYEECLALSKIDLNIVKKLSWRKWQSMLDRSDEYDARIYKWIENYPNKIGDNNWRMFLKIHRAFFKNKDSSVFDDNDIFAIYDYLLLMSDIWFVKIKDFGKNHPKSTKLKNGQKWSQKYIELCLQKKKELKVKYITTELCESVFDDLMN